MTARWAVALLAAALVSPPAGTPVHGGDRSPLPVCRVSTGRPLVAVTFDDGPFPAATAAARRLLRRHDARATFFLVGGRAFRRPGVVAALRRDGMEVANHTWSHVVPAGLGPDRSAAEIRRTADAIAGAEALFRPPQGRIDLDGLRAAREAGLLTVVWSVAVERYTSGRPVDEAARELLARIGPGDIVLAHERAPGTLAAIERLLDGLASRGLRAVSVTELLDAGRPVRALPVDGPLTSGNARYVCPG